MIIETAPVRLLFEESFQGSLGTGLSAKGETREHVVGSGFSYKANSSEETSVMLNGFPVG